MRRERGSGSIVVRVGLEPAYIVEIGKGAKGFQDKMVCCRPNLRRVPPSSNRSTQITAWRSMSCHMDLFGTEDDLNSSVAPTAPRYCWRMFAPEVTPPANGSRATSQTGPGLREPPEYERTKFRARRVPRSPENELVDHRMSQSDQARHMDQGSTCSASAAHGRSSPSRWR